MAKVTVTRAPRMKLVRLAHMPLGTLFLNNMGWIRHKNAQGDSCLDDSGEFKTPAWEDTLTYFVFEDWNAMCKWVSAGRNPADLQSDSKSEWVDFGSFTGEWFTLLDSVVNEKAEFTYTGDYPIPRVCQKIVVYKEAKVNEIGVDFLQAAMYGQMVWPVRFDLGDTITIKGEEK